LAKAQAKPTGAGLKKCAAKARASPNFSMVRLWFSYFQPWEKSSLVVESKGEILSTPLVYRIERK
jgi:hypothetical protein